MRNSFKFNGFSTYTTVELPFKLAICSHIRRKFWLLSNIIIFNLIFSLPVFKMLTTVKPNFEILKDNLILEEDFGSQFEVGNLKITIFGVDTFEKDLIKWKKQ